VNSEAVLQIFGRADELELLRKRLAARKSTLVFGPSGVGKTLLLQQVVPGRGHILYCPVSSSPQAVCRRLAELLIAAQDATLLRLCKGGLDALAGKSFVSLKGIVSSVLRAENYLVVLDHLHRPSPALGALIGEFMLSCATPVIAVARSAHMEDAGSVSPLLPDRSERLAIRNFDSETAKTFAREVCEQQQLSGENLSSVLDSIVKSSDGNPGAILRMIAMAKQSKYRNDGHIKWSPLYIDFLMQSARENAL
jgi:hypothetical protein